MPNVGRKGSGKHTQSVLFIKTAEWTKETSRSWLVEHKYKTDGHEETDTHHRWRQFDPEAEKFRYRNQSLEGGITLVLAFPQSAERSGAERRMCVKAELRVSDAGGAGMPVIEGYAALFNVRSEHLGFYFEEIRAGAFTRTLAEDDDVRALIDHESSRILGRTTANTLDLWEDDWGLGVRIHPPQTQLARDLVTSMRRGDIDQMSFAFAGYGKDGRVKDTWTIDDNDDEIRTLEEVKLYDVSIVTFPAYPDTTVAVRSRDAFRTVAADIRRRRRKEEQRERLARVLKG